jgi:hypothetical protein
MRLTIRSPAGLFAAVALAVYLTAVVLSGQLGSLPNGRGVAAGVAMDLMLLVPGAYYLLVVRPRRWPVAAVAPVVIAGLAMAALILPAGHRAPLRVAEVVLIPVEIALLSWVVWRAAHGFRTAGTTPAADPLARLQVSAGAVVPGRLAHVVATELAVLYYALASWRARPHVPAGATAFSTHQQSGQGGIVFALLLIVAVEGVVGHLLLASWSAAAAWGATALTGYSALWLVADYRATVLGPVTWDGTSLWLRCGLRWRGSMARAQLTRIARRPLDGHSTAPRGRSR